MGGSRLALLGIAVACVAVLAAVPAARAVFVAGTSSASSHVAAADDFPIRLDAASSASGLRVTSLTWSHTVGAGPERLLLVGVSVTGEDSVSGVTFGGAPLTLVGAETHESLKSRVEIWRLLAPASGAASVVVTFAETTRDDAVAGATSWEHVDQSTPLGTPSWASGESTTASTTLSSAAGQVAVDVVAVDQAAAAAGSGQTLRWSAFLDRVAGAGSTEPGAASVTMSWGLGRTARWSMGAIAIRPAHP